jgi:predicted ester cyclase
MTRFTFRGTHQGEFMGVPATGKVVTVTGIYISRIAGGKVVEDWSSSDMPGVMQQLGAIPQMAQGGA